MIRMNQDMLRIWDWCLSNKLLINPEKTKLLVFGSRQMTAKVNDFRLSLLGNEREPVTVARDIGVMLDAIF